MSSRSGSGRSDRTHGTWGGDPKYKSVNKTKAHVKEYMKARSNVSRTTKTTILNSEQRGLFASYLREQIEKYDGRRMDFDIFVFLHDEEHNEWMISRQLSRTLSAFPKVYAHTTLGPCQLDDVLNRLHNPTERELRFLLTGYIQYLDIFKYGWDLISQRIRVELNLGNSFLNKIRNMMASVTITRPLATRLFTVYHLRYSSSKQCMKHLLDIRYPPPDYTIPPPSEVSGSHSHQSPIIRTASESKESMSTSASTSRSASKSKSKSTIKISKPANETKSPVDHHHVRRDVPSMVAQFETNHRSLASPIRRTDSSSSANTEPAIPHRSHNRQRDTPPKPNKPQS